LELPGRWAGQATAAPTGSTAPYLALPSSTSLGCKNLKLGDEKAALWF